jgi:prevent-host-death family protein
MSMLEKDQRYPEKTWQLQEAKAKLSEVVEKALTEGPQRVTRHGKDSVIVVSEEDYWGVRERPPLYEALRSSAFVKYAQDLDLTRSKDLPRDFEF